MSAPVFRRPLRLGWTLAPAAALAVWLAFGATIVNPVVIADEVVVYLTGVAGPHLQAARDMQAAVQRSGALLFPAAIHALAGLPGSTAAWVKAFDALAFASAAGALAGAGRNLRTGRRPAALALALGLAPIGAYSALVLPESLYFALFAAAVLALCAGKEPTRRPLARAGAAGALVGLMTLAKPHGLMVLLALETALGGWALMGRGLGRTRGALAQGAAAALGFAAAFVTVGWMVTPPGLAAKGDLLGADYRAQLGAAAGGLQRLAQGAALSVRYLVAVAALWTPALAVLLMQLRPGGEGAPGNAADRARFAGLFVLILLALLLAAVPLVVASEEDRIHLRYLNFALPAALALAARLSPPELSPRAAWAIGGAWLAVAVALALLPGWRPLPVDAPELFFLYGGVEFGGFGLGPLARPLFVALVLAAAAALATRRLRWLHAQVLVLAVTGAISTYDVWRVCQVWQAAGAADRALGAEAARRCGPGAGDVVAIGSPATFTALFPALYTLGRPAPLLSAEGGEVERAFPSLPAHLCVITTLPMAREVDLLAASPALRLYRKR